MKKAFIQTVLFFGVTSFISVSANCKVILPSSIINSFQEDDQINNKVTKMTEAVGLTDTQKAKYKAYLIKKKKEGEELMSKTYANDAEKELAQLTFRDKTEKEFKKILTTEQYIKFKAKLEADKKASKKTKNN